MEIDPPSTLAQDAHDQQLTIPGFPNMSEDELDTLLQDFIDGPDLEIDPLPLDLIEQNDESGPQL